MAIAPGDRFDRYEILGFLGRGGMGEVYLALDTRLNRKVALKLLPSEFTRNPDRVTRFDQEALAASALNHPNILTVFEIGQVDDVHFIATEFIDGETLRSRIGSGGRSPVQDASAGGASAVDMAKPPRLPAAEAIDIAIQLASALAAAHEAGVIHRDIKPENVMLRRDGYVKVLDFGLAKLTETAIGASDALTAPIVHTEARVVMGTARYMSPEQARGVKVDARTDIFSLGIVIYEMLAGTIPFEFAPGPPPLSRYAPEAPAALDRLLAKAVRADRAERYQDVKELLTDLRRVRQELDGNQPAHQIQPSETARSTSSAEYLVNQLKRHRAVASLAAAVILLTGTAAGYFAWHGKAIESVAILPFANVGGTPDTEWLSDGLTESLISQLSQVPQLTVRPRQAVFRYKGRDVDPQTVGRELNVQAVLTGRVVLRGDALSVSLDLVEVRGNRQLWGDQYDYKLAKLLDVQTEISRSVTERLRLRLSGVEQEQLTRISTHDAEAHQLYLKGRFHWSQLTDDGIRQAVPYFREAVKRDPNYALAYVGLADSYIQLGADLVPPKEAMPEAKANALEALRLDDTLTEAHVALGIVKLLYEWDWTGAQRELAHRLTATLHGVEAFSCALHYSDPLGRNDDAIAEIKRVLDRDPLSLIAVTELGCASYYGRHYEQSIAQFRKALTTNPDFVYAIAGLGRAYAQKGMYKEAIATMSPSVTVSNNWPPIVSELAYAYARSGQRAEALKLLQQLQTQATRRYVDPYLIAEVQVGLDDKDQAFLWLEKAYQNRSISLPWLKLEPKFESLRADPRFADLLRRVGLAS